MSIPEYSVMPEPLLVEADALDPDVLEPGALDPGMLDPGMLDPDVLEPGALDPGMLDPGTLEVGLEPDALDDDGLEPNDDPEPHALSARTATQVMAVATFVLVAVMMVSFQRVGGAVAGRSRRLA